MMCTFPPELELDPSLDDVCVSFVFTSGSLGGCSATSYSFGTSTVDKSSPSSANIAIVLPTLTFLEPLGTTIFARTPSSCASTSIWALSVSISRRMSPDLNDCPAPLWPDLLICKPSCIFHDAMLPSVMVGDMAGILNRVVTDRLNDVVKKTSKNIRSRCGWLAYNEDLGGWLEVLAETAGRQAFWSTEMRA